MAICKGGEVCQGRVQQHCSGIDTVGRIDTQHLVMATLDVLSLGFERPYPFGSSEIRDPCDECQSFHACYSLNSTATTNSEGCWGTGAAGEP